MTVHETLLPPGWPRPKGYANGIAASGRTIYTVAILAEGGAAPEHIVRMTCYVTDRDAYVASLAEIGAAWRDIIGKNYPAMAVVAVTALVEHRAKVEIETTAVVPV